MVVSIILIVDCFLYSIIIRIQKTSIVIRSRPARAQARDERVCVCDFVGRPGKYRHRQKISVRARASGVSGSSGKVLYQNFRRSSLPERTDH